MHSLHHRDHSQLHRTR